MLSIYVSDESGHPKHCTKVKLIGELLPDLESQKFPDLKAVDGDREEEGEALDGELLPVLGVGEMQVLEVEPEHHGEGKKVGQLLWKVVKNAFIIWSWWSKAISETVAQLP